MSRKCSEGKRNKFSCKLWVDDREIFAQSFKVPISVKMDRMIQKGVKRVEKISPSSKSRKAIKSGWKIISGSFYYFPQTFFSLFSFSGKFPLGIIVQDKERKKKMGNGFSFIFLFNIRWNEIKRTEFSCSWDVLRDEMRFCLKAKPILRRWKIRNCNFSRLYAFSSLSLRWETRKQRLSAFAGLSPD